MASHGTVMDLMDDRFLNLQDVAGNVRPFPALVPYHDWGEAALVYRMNVRHEIFLTLVQDFTDRRATDTNRELWTWWVQWEVTNTSAVDTTAATPSPKKPRLDGHPQASRPTQNKMPTETICERTYIDHEIFKDEITQRILIGIVQVDSKLVPNWIEFLYQWIDYSEGDGRALRAALSLEIPSLWDFELHPLTINGLTLGILNHMDRIKRKSTDKETEGTRHFGQVAQKLGAKASARKEPDSRQLEELTEQSERMRYKEVKFGMQRPIDPKDEPIPPLINIPRDVTKRNRYYAACFRNRQRAYHLLLQAGISTGQIANYKRRQEIPPKDTPEDIQGPGFANYHKDQPWALTQYTTSQEMARQHEKQKEIALSVRLALEAHVAARIAHARGNGPSAQAPPPPPIPPPSLNDSRLRTTNLILARMRVLPPRPDTTIRFVPSPVFGKMKSKLFGCAMRRSAASTSNFDQDETEDDDWDETDMGDDGDEDNHGYMDDVDDMEDDGHIDDVDNVDNDDDMFYDDDMDDDNSSDSDDDNDTGEEDNGDTAHGDSPVARIASNVSQYLQALNRTQFHNSLLPLNNQAQQGGPNSIVMNLNPVFGTQNPFMSSETAASCGPFNPSPSLYHQSFPNPLAVMAPSQAQPPAITVTGTGSAAPFSPGRPGPVLPIRLHDFVPNQGLTPNTPTAFQTPSSLQSANRAQPPPHLNIQRTQYLQPGQPGVTSNPSPGPFTPLAANLATKLTLNSPLAATPLAASPLAASPLAASPLAASPHGIPIQVYIPRVISNPDLGRGHEHDALLLGYSHPDRATIQLTAALFLPAHVWENTMNRVRLGKFTHIETYAVPYTHPTNPHGSAARGEKRVADDSPHKAIYEKLATAHGFMTSARDREGELTKRWRCTGGPLTAADRGAVWEGWGLYVDRPVEMGPEERRGALVFRELDGELRRHEESEERRERESEEWLTGGFFSAGVRVRRWM